MHPGTQFIFLVCMFILQMKIIITVLVSLIRISQLREAYEYRILFLIKVINIHFVHRLPIIEGICSKHDEYMKHKCNI